jgi:O-antigen/teichoic acid export membrane protein
VPEFTKLFSAVKWSFLSTVINNLVSLLKYVILSRILSKNDFGLISICLIIIGLAEVFKDFGMSSAIMHKRHISIKEYSSLYFFGLIVGLLVFVILFLLSGVFADFFNEAELDILLPVISITILFSAIGFQHKYIQLKSLNFKFVEKIEILSNFLSFILVWVLAKAGYGVYALVYAHVFQYALSNLIFAIQGMKNQKYHFRLNIRELKPFLKIGGFQTAGQIVNYFNSQLDQLLIGKVLGMNTLGAYSLSKNLASKPFMISNPIMMKVSIPFMSQVQADENNLKNGYLQMLKFSSIVNFPLYVVGAYFGSEIISLVYGEKYLEYSSIFIWLCVYFTIRSLITPIGALLVSKGRTDWDFYWNCFVFVSFPLIFYFFMQAGIGTASRALVCIIAIYFFLSFYWVVKSLIVINLAEVLAVLKLALVGTVIMLIIFFTIDLIFGKSVILVLVSVPIGLAAYLLWLNFAKTTNPEIGLIIDHIFNKSKTQ